MKRLLVFSVLFFLLINISFSQNLKRKAYLGINVSSLTDEQKQKYDIEFGVYVDELIDEELSKIHKFEQGDIILTINNNRIDSIHYLYSEVLKYRQDDECVSEVIRNGKKKTLKGKFPPKPYETSEKFDVIYDEIAFMDGYLRVIVDKPSSDKPMPAILFIPGYTCGSYDNINPLHPYIRLIKSLAERGYVVMRVEKPGDGDCYNLPACEDIDFHTEVQVFAEALKKLQSFDFVDNENIFIWGHSMGGIIAPIIASENQVKGIIVYGTGIKPWREYIVEMCRVQYPIMGMDWVETENRMLCIYNTIHALFIEKKSPAEIANDSVMADILYNDFGFDGKDRLFTRNYKYLVQIDDYNLTECWSKVEAYVLTMWGTVDLEAFSRVEHQTIVDVVNFYHPDKAEFYEVVNTSHAFFKANSYKEAIDNYNWNYMTENFNPIIIEKTDEWIKDKMKK